MPTTNRPSASDPLLSDSGPLMEGTIVDRPNRFVLRTAIEGVIERAFLGDPGALTGVIEPGRSVLCRPVEDPERSTDYDAIAVACDNRYVSVRPALANDLFEKVLERGLIRGFAGYRSIVREPPYPDHGRADFRLESDDGSVRFVEVKSCTHVEDGVAMFPDRQTERGRRHLKSLEALVENEIECSIVFVVQRPDAHAFRPYREVDPEFARLLDRVRSTGVDVRAITTDFEPPHYFLRNADLPIER